MFHFDTSDLTTYAALFNFLRDEARPFHATPDDLHRISHAASRIAHLQANYANFENCRSCGDEAPLAPYVRHLISDLEALGVRGWIRSLEEHRMHGAYEELKQVLEMSCREVEELRAREKDSFEVVQKLEGSGGETAKVMAPGSWYSAARLQQQKDILQYEEGGEKLGGVTERLEKLAGSHEVEIEGPRKAAPVSMHEHLDLSEVESEVYRDELVQTHTEHEKSHHRPRPFSEKSVVVEVGSWSVGSHTARAVGPDPSKDLACSPPLQLLTKNEQEDDNKNAKCLEEQNKIWRYGQRELEKTHLSTGSPSPLYQHLPPPAPFYIFISLPANFTLPQNKSHLPSQTFKTSASILHFPEGANKDQLLAALRQQCAIGLAISNFEPSADVNVMHVRTHCMEWELKNAILKTMTQEQWEESIGRQWYTEGKGDTYIVCKTDVHFHNMSGALTSRDEDTEVHKTSATVE
jgi:hypothetical protein